MIYEKGDIHMHTTNSDGKYSPVEIRNKVYASSGNKVASITDHQYMTDKKAFKENNVLWIPGIEISAIANGIPVHITGYGVEPKFSNKLKTIIKTLITGYVNREQKRKKENVFFVEEENFMPDVKELIPAMHESNMIACRAHPGKKSFRKPEEIQSGGELLDYIVSAGIDGIEIFSHTHTSEQSNLFIKEANKRKLLITGGADYHGEEGHNLNYALDTEYIRKFLEAIDYRE